MMIDYELLDGVLTPYELAVYSVLKRHENSETHQCWPHQTTLAKEALCTDRCVRDGLKWLENVGLITITRTLKGNIYTLLEVTDTIIERCRAAQTQPEPRSAPKRKLVPVVPEPRSALKELDEVNKTQVNKTGVVLDSPSAALALSARSAETTPALSDDERERKAAEYHVYLETLSGKAVPQGRRGRAA